MNRTASKPRGFACLTPQRRAEIASKGGKAAHEAGTAHEFGTDEARAAGAKGGQAVSADREHMAKIGAKAKVAGEECGACGCSPCGCAS